MVAGTSYFVKYYALAYRAAWETRASNHANELFKVGSKNLGDHPYLNVVTI